jgi:hypothetical protein
MRANGFEPLADYPGATQPWPCRCQTCDRDVVATFGGVRSGYGCSLCWEDRRGETLRLAPETAANFMREHGLEPLVPYPGSGAAWLCRCTTCDKHVDPAYNSVRRGSGCRYCAAEQRGAARRYSHELASEFMRNAGFEPLEEYRSALTKWRCRCLNPECGRIVQPRYAGVRNGRGCRYCKKSGFNYAKPSYVYIMIDQRRGAVKPGIANAGPELDRVVAHRRKGWELFRRLPCATGDEAWLIERAVLIRLWLRVGHKRGYLTAEDMPQYGWTETFDRDEISELFVWSMVREEATRLANIDNEVG